MTTARLRGVLSRIGCLSYADIAGPTPPTTRFGACPPHLWAVRPTEPADELPSTFRPTPTAGCRSPRPARAIAPALLTHTTTAFAPAAAK